MELKDKVIVITGASSGIGEATAIRLAADGAKLVLMARREERMQELAQKLMDEHQTESMVVKLDITDREAVLKAFEAVKENFGRIDALINNAGLMPVSYMDKLKIDEWDRMIDVNLKGLLYCIAGVLPVMKAQGGGHIVNISSVAGRRVNPGFAVYNATKFGVTALSEAMRMELTPTMNIKVSVIEPGAVATELTQTITDEDILNAFNKRGNGMIPLEADDIARAIQYALSQPDEVMVSEVLVMPRKQQ
ncbi:MAG: SDR family oxidoreductase [Bacteroidetes bacterium]|jgi:NADP-dependent 3-hydroxy acid dehydrogenase YdfG|nr:SDR family oxidoreductase [Bacteroidota bacterium]MBU1577923.1 SDR family oxidoreductase [Bacteroidota bacterium]MBU2558586.1 SDR family oxidoreductase [Bacteroidota bacterium]MDA3943834.1 SDR family oxidoreductase [Bacteroidota bacterium]